MTETNYAALMKKQLENLYDAEQQIVRALPGMIGAASSEELTDALEEHLLTTREQVRRLDRVFESLGYKPESKTCQGMAGLLKEGDEAIKEIVKSPVLDAALVAAAQRVEHYEIAAYGTARTMAEALDQMEAAELLEETLEEEEAANESLMDIAEAIMSGEVASEEEEEAEAKGEIDSD